VQLVYYYEEETLIAETEICGHLANSLESNHYIMEIN